MTLNSIIALFLAMVILASLPSISVLMVCTRTASGGFIHGFCTTLGIVLGDIIFILLAIWGLSFLAETMGGLFIFIKYLGSAYLIFLGIGLLRSCPVDEQPDNLALLRVDNSLVSSFLTGLFITLADQKATLFYLGFLPAFVNITQISYQETLVIIAVAIIAVGGVKLIYALMADKVSIYISAKTTQGIKIIAGCLMIIIGVILLF
ncbi:MAG: LysE family translocator [Gloeocapsa sp. DLM2.Bin57]|nr:MAG: LysE family translocator [Gloeocapsa sp. DLM2.Bin57]